MPRDSSGNYTLPPGNPVIDGTVIDVNWANPTMVDVAAQLNNLLTRDGLLGATGAIKFADGTVGLPGITWAAEPTMGFYRVGGNQMGLSIAGVNRMLWTPTATTFNSDVNFAADANFAGALNLTGLLHLAGDAQIDGELGIGTVPSTLKLDVLGSLAGVARIDSTAITGTYLGISSLASAKARIGVGSAVITGAASTDLGFSTEGANNILFSANAGAEHMRLQANGFLGIGGVAFAKLHIYNGDQNIEAPYPGSGLTPASRGLTFLTRNSTTAFVAGASIQAVWNRLSDTDFGSSMLFYTAADNSSLERMRIDNNGCVGIGRAPTANVRLDVAAVDDARLMLDGTGSGIGSGGTILFARTSVTKGTLGVRANRFGDSRGDIYFQGNDGIVIATGAGVGTMAIQIETNQFVGIGRSGGVKLDILGVNNVVGWGGNADLRVSSNNGSVATTYGWNQMGTTADYAWGNATGEHIRMFGAGNVGISGNGATAMVSVTASGLEVKGASNTMVLHGGSSGGYQGLRLYNDLYSSTRSLEMDYSGSAWAGQFVTDGPVGEQGAIVTTGAFPLSLGTSNRARIQIPASSASPVLMLQNGNSYNAALDPGSASGSIPIGGIIAGNLAGLGGGGLACLATVVLSGALTIQMTSFAPQADIILTSGTYRLLSRVSSNFCVYIRTA